MGDTKKGKCNTELSALDLLKRIEYNMSDIICIHDLDGKYKYVSPSVLAILGYTPRELIGTSPYDLFHCDDAEQIRKRSHDLAVAGMTIETRIEYRCRRKDGGFSWLDTQTTPICDDEGNVCELLTMSRDITKRKMLEDLYLQSEKRLREFADAVPDISFIIDEDGLFVEVFGSEEMLHRTKEKILGKTTHEVLPVEAADFILGEVKHAIGTGMQRNGRLEMQLGCETHCFTGRAAPLTLSVNGKKTAAVVATDVTHQHKTEKMLQTLYEVRRRSDIINDILKGTTDIANSGYIFNQLGLDIRFPTFALKLLSERFGYDAKNPRRVDGTNTVQGSKDGVISAISEIPNCLAWDCREGIGVLCQVTDESPEWGRDKEIVSLIKTQIMKYDPSLVISMGVSEVHTGINGLKEICQQALRAAIAARCRMGERIVHYRDAGLFQLVPDSLGVDSVNRYVNQHIGQLLAYDKSKKTSYLDTLEEYLRGSSIREIAEKQYLHSKSVTFRLKQITKILQADLKDYETRQTLSVAIQLNRMK